ncbi:hypothetical protein [Cupriavidus metallidurans]|uniref:hypothetical protein n=1 Tax=Cupriavidus metallidurans TaxID=119219 RepID=UPI00126851EE|nr:hypothetical protein [Cupriavidus metallidurans]QGS30281.1 hypothetical protein FOB83_16075 [Cupriavidus metallidurans]UBM09675.1 hypothetical protein LAI70_20485 [Cupriavidus metallidurans]
MGAMQKIVALVGLACFSVSVFAKWEYSENEDKMRGTKVKYAALASDNLVPLDFPYKPGTRLNIMIRKKSGAKDEVILQVDKGQIPCGYSGCKVSAKFDEGQVQTYAGAGTDSGRSDVIFVEASAKFLKALKSSKKVIVEVQFFQSGRQQFEFDSSGLEWK